MHFFASEGIQVPGDLLVLAVQARAASCKYYDRIASFNYDAVEMARRTAEKLLEIKETGTSEPHNELWFRGEFVLPASATADLTAIQG
jgi:DNA-binding LacI/PurR family transcriptional regulator